MKQGFAFGAILVLVGAIIQMFKLAIMGIPISAILILVGGLCMLFSRGFNVIPDDTRLKRLKFQEFISNILIILSAYLIFINDTRWMITLLIGAVVELWVTYRMPEEGKK
ncbi:MAG: hypothetical protein M0P12_06480 [Paludibacteraceae bacterium]|mgnify:CR=1 FL=1|jgi:hypothetical protein|nr:hypothetical protein [Paludibacteraceae bacterium]HOI26390.1 hypothetical protein [Paludibacteraceae bacterium]HOU67552.1 hypothetical protein [Paludibacteraceae bacterium]HPH62379.1 hypothetical protein [Paludibacteraceae bacterium]HQF49600.1 hypothetical protein [Paludibacteraceae bacterium]